MKIRIGDMWSQFGEVDVFAVTTNATLNQNGSLVMGRGMALQARDRLNDIDLMFGQAIADYSHQTGMPLYGAIIVQYMQQHMCAFQVKVRYQEQARRDVIQYSTASLFAFLVTNPSWTVALNCPGIGNGRLPYYDVEPIIRLLPDTVSIWFTPEVAKQVGVKEG